MQGNTTRKRSRTRSRTRTRNRRGGVLSPRRSTRVRAQTHTFTQDMAAQMTRDEAAKDKKKAKKTAALKRATTAKRDDKKTKARARAKKPTDALADTVNSNDLDSDLDSDLGDVKLILNSDNNNNPVTKSKKPGFLSNFFYGKDKEYPYWKTGELQPKTLTLWGAKDRTRYNDLLAEYNRRANENRKERYGIAKPLTDAEIDEKMRQHPEMYAQNYKGPKLTDREAAKIAALMDRETRRAMKAEQLRQQGLHKPTSRAATQAIMAANRLPRIKLVIKNDKHAFRFPSRTAFMEQLQKGIDPHFIGTRKTRMTKIKKK